MQEEEGQILGMGIIMMLPTLHSFRKGIPTTNSPSDENHIPVAISALMKIVSVVT